MPIEINTDISVFLLTLNSLFYTEDLTFDSIRYVHFLRECSIAIDQRGSGHFVSYSATVIDSEEDTLLIEHGGYVAQRSVVGLRHGLYIVELPPETYADDAIEFDIFSHLAPNIVHLLRLENVVNIPGRLWDYEALQDTQE